MRMEEHNAKAGTGGDFCRARDQGGDEISGACSDELGAVAVLRAGVATAKNQHGVTAGTSRRRRLEPGLARLRTDG
jgi:hypothetical protein